MSDDLVCLDGRLIPAVNAFIPVTDEGFLRGDGVFEVVRVYDGQAFALHQHLERLEQSAANLRLELPVDVAQIRSEAEDLLSERGGRDFNGLLRIVVTRHGHRLLMTEPLPRAARTARLCFVTYSPSRVLDGVKSLSYAANMLASRLARERGFDEALLTTPHGRVLEAPTSSLFFVEPNGELCTPPLDDHILASITRQLVIELAGAVERPLTVDGALETREAFLTSTTREVQPVSAIEDHELAAPGERTMVATELLREHIRSALS